MTTTLTDHANGPDSLGARLNDQLQHRAGEPLLILNRRLPLTAAFESAVLGLLEQVQKEVREPVVLTVMSNAAADLNPYAGLAPKLESIPETQLLEGLVALLGPGEVMEWHSWPDHFVLISAAAVEALTGLDITPENALMHLQRAGGKLLIADSVFLHDPGVGLFDEEALEPHEQRRPTAWGLLKQRLDGWLQLLESDPLTPWRDSLSDFQAADKPVTLHVTHSWGGGVARWVESFIEADSAGVNLQLRSEGPQSGQGYGQHYALYLGNQVDTPVASWWLQPAIRSTASEHPHYRGILREILERYGIGRLVVSSLVGHSLDALETGLPTIQILHDFYPLWPLLGIHPVPYIGSGPESCLESALQDHSLLPGFVDRDADGWKTLGQQWRNSIVNWGVRIAAPSRSVADLIRLLDPDWAAINIEIIPHGLPDLPGTAQVIPKERDDGRLRLVIPGRIQQGKGQRLLLEALPGLTDFAQVYLLGAGKEGEVFFGRPGVNVVIQYQRDDLRQLLATIGPHAAGLLSIVPETFSYTLSEMQQLDIPVIATRVGSLAERISDGETGWLIEPDPEALIERVKALAAERSELQACRARLQAFDLPGSDQMVGKYQKICMPRPARRKAARVQSLDEAQAAALAFQMTDLAARNRSLAEQKEALQAEVEKRSAWAEATENARKEEVERRIRWVSELEGYLQESQGRLQETQELLDRTDSNLKEARGQLHETANELEREQEVHRQTNLRLENLSAMHEWVLGTASWRLTRPFRVLGRISTNLARARAWNPLRWPLLLSQTVRTLSTQGLKGAVARSQSTRIKLKMPTSPDLATIEPIGDPGTPPGFPVLDKPEVSIVIPVYNKWAYTAACLRSLAERQCDVGFEVIVVDDQSSDETRELLPEVEGLTVIRNECNLGFVGSCNLGAESARGRYLVMLNNDTQVTDGWLDALIDTFERYPDTGIAGARLIYPDGKLQEAGGIIFKDGSGWNYGKGDQAERPEYRYTREVDYCSGACIMLETSLFRELGGFDPLYAPAYYEDTDLAFRVRAKGLKVRVQPAASIVHHEGVTSGTDIGAGVKRYQAVNHEKFLARWSTELARYPKPISDPDNRAEIRRARDHRLKGRILIIDAYTPEPDQDSGSVRLRYLMDCLGELGYGVTFLADNRTHAGSYTTALQQAGIEAVYDPWVQSLSQFFSDREDEFDFVMISRHYVAANYLSLLKRYCRQARFIFDTVDLHFLREERMAELEDSLPLRRSAVQTRRSELAVIKAADATIVVSPVEKAVLAEAAPGAKVHVISNVHEVTGSQRPFAQRKDIFFVGGYQHPPNIDAAQWFVGSIWPLIREELPDIEFHLIGSKAPEQVRALQGNGVRFHGFVKTLEPWLDGCRLAVAPLRYGAGIKGKVNMSMSRGQPVVATPMAVEGMFAEAGREVLVAESPQDFASEVVRLYRDEELWNRVSAAGLENVCRYFSVETARLGLQELLGSLE